MYVFVRIRRGLGKEVLSVGLLRSRLVVRVYCARIDGMSSFGSHLLIANHMWILRPVNPKH